MNHYPDCLKDHVCYLVEEVTSVDKICDRFPSRLIVPLLIQPVHVNQVDWTSPHWKTLNPRPFFVSPFGLECIRKGMLPELDTSGYEVVNYRTGEKLGCLVQPCAGC